MIVALTAVCISAAASSYHIPESALWTLLAEEGGRVGQAASNQNHTTDLGPFQINSAWVPAFADLWHISPDEAYADLRDNGCWSAAAAAAIVRGEWNLTGDLLTAIGRYHSARPELAAPYVSQFVKLHHRLFGSAPASRVPPR